MIHVIPFYEKKVRLNSFLIYPQVARRIFAKTKAMNPIFLGFINLIVKGQNQISQSHYKASCRLLFLQIKSVFFNLSCLTKKIGLRNNFQSPIFQSFKIARELVFASSNSNKRNCTSSSYFRQDAIPLLNGF